MARKRKDKPRDVLTGKQRMFCQEYIKDWNATRAAIKAGYSKKTAYSIGQENLRKPELQKYIEQIQRDLEKLAGISRLMVLHEHMKIAFSSIAHMHNTWIERVEFDKLTEDQKACISEISTSTKTILNDDIPVTVEYVKIKLYDKQKALENISRMLGYDSPVKHDLTTGGEKLNTADPEIKEKLNAALKILKGD